MVNDSQINLLYILLRGISKRDLSSSVCVGFVCLVDWMDGLVECHWTGLIGGSFNGRRGSHSSYQSMDTNLPRLRRRIMMVGRSSPLITIPLGCHCTFILPACLPAASACLAQQEVYAIACAGGNKFDIAYVR